MNSAAKSGQKILGVISPADAEQLLTDLANAREDGLGRVLLRHSRSLDLLKVNHEDARALMPGKTPPSVLLNWHTVLRIAVLLRRAWTEPDDRLFEWYLWKAISIPTPETWLSLQGDEPPEHVTPLEAATFYLREYRSRAKRCPNPECAAPYFFRGTKKKAAKFCDDDRCADASRAAAKRKWWTDNRAKKAKKKQGKKK